MFTWQQIQEVGKYTIALLNDIRIVGTDESLGKEVMLMARRIFKPGHTVPTSGQYEIYGPRGGKTGQEVTAVKGEPFPPTQKKNQKYKLVDKTK